MNPYTTPNESLEPTEVKPLKSEGIVEHPMYSGVLRMVLWGEEREEINHRMEVNRVSLRT